MIKVISHASLEINHMQVNLFYESRNLKAEMSLLQALFES